MPSSSATLRLAHNKQKQCSHCGWLHVGSSAPVFLAIPLGSTSQQEWHIANYGWDSKDFYGYCHSKVISGFFSQGLSLPVCGACWISQLWWQQHGPHAHGLGTTVLALASTSGWESPIGGAKPWPVEAWYF